MSDDEHVKRIKPAWRRITAWCQDHAPETFTALRQPAGVQAIEAAERATGIAWPAELKKWYSLHDGVDPLNWNAALLFGYMPTSLEMLVSTHRMMVDIWTRNMEELTTSSLEELMREPAGSRAGVYLPCYLPFGNDGCGGELVLDARGGAWTGPITGFDKVEAETGESPEWCSLAELLEDIAESLKTGRETRSGLIRQVVLDWRPV
jgi:cell wall assembly regulator SMI1